MVSGGWASHIYELDVQQLDAFRRGPLAEMIGVRSEGKRVPGFVWTAPPAFKLAFLQSLLAGDGSSSLLPGKTIQISYPTRSPRRRPPLTQSVAR